VRIALDEWNYWYGEHIYGELGVRYRLKDALGIAVGLNEMIRNSDLFFMANYAQTVNVIGCIKTNKTEAVFATTALPLIMYRKYFGTAAVEVKGEQGLMDITAAMTQDGKYLTIAAVNLSDKENIAKINIKGVQLKGGGLLWQVKGDLNDYNQPGREDVVKITEQKVSSISDKLTMPGYSINLYRFELK
jgi:alpha-L-arabinofuranosidase